MLSGRTVCTENGLMVDTESGCCGCGATVTHGSNPDQTGHEISFFLLSREGA